MCEIHHHIKNNYETVEKFEFSIIILYYFETVTLFYRLKQK